MSDQLVFDDEEEDDACSECDDEDMDCSCGRCLDCCDCDDDGDEP